MNKKKNKSAASVMGKYMRYPILFVVIMLIATALVWLYNSEALMIMLIATLVCVVASLLVYFYYRQTLTKSLVDFAINTNENQAILMQDLDVPYALMNQDGQFEWHNRAFNALVTGDKVAKKDITGMFPEIDEDVLAKLSSDTKTFHCTFREKKFEIVIRPTELDTERAYAVYLYDETELMAILRKYDEDSQAIGLINLDNYEEVTDGIEEEKKSLLVALVDRNVAKYIADVDGIVKKLEKDKYLFIVKKMYLERMEAERFSLLDEVKKVNVGNSITTTVSIGVGLGAESFAENYTNAKTAIDMALARGGDQAVVKEGQAVRYFGGKSQSIEKSTRVKARVKAEALKGIINDKDRVIIMGHKMMDIDCLGAAVGIWKIAGSLGKEAHIVVGEASASIEQMLERFHTSEYPEDMFISNADALDLLDDDAVLAIVDVNKPSLTEAPELIDIAKTVVVFDHHRQGRDIVENAALSYVEPYASSACEMIAEVLQYVNDEIHLRQAEADAMFAGISVDTYNFTNQAGVRTFEAAAYLRKNGADVTRVRKLFRDSLEDYHAKAEAIHAAEVYEGAFVVSECNAEGLASPTVIGAQAANELLDIKGVKASFVLTKFRDQVFISARSIDEVNVQIIMEKLGGGGHRSIAGAQLTCTVDEARTQLKELITEMIKMGELDQ